MRNALRERANGRCGRKLHKKYRDRLMNTGTTEYARLPRQPTIYELARDHSVQTLYFLSRRTFVIYVTPLSIVYSYEFTSQVDSVV